MVPWIWERIAAINIEVGGESPGFNLDRLDLTGALGANGALEVSLIGPFQPLGGERFQILVFDRLEGWFDKLSLPQLMHMLAWNVDVSGHEVGLEVVCHGTQLAIVLAADRDPVSVGHEVLLEVNVANFSSVLATDVVAGATLPPELTFRQDLSSPECGLIGAAVECSTPSLGPGASWHPVIAMEPVLSGMAVSGGWVDAWECDTDDSDDSATATIFAVAAMPCDANDDANIGAGDLVPAVKHIFGERAEGNPDCRLANGITADDLAAIIVASQ